MSKKMRLPLYLLVKLVRLLHSLTDNPNNMSIWNTARLAT